MKRGSVLLSVPVMALLFITGCSERRDAAVANSAASIYEAAKAIDEGVDARLVTPSIRAQAFAIILAMEHTYAPAEREFNKEGP
jgi:hypothetical protein